MEQNEVRKQQEGNPGIQQEATEYSGEKTEMEHGETVCLEMEACEALVEDLGSHDGSVVLMVIMAPFAIILIIIVLILLLPIFLPIFL